MKRQRKIVVHISDTHGGSKLALMGPDVTLFEEGPEGEIIPWHPQQSADNRLMWQLYTSHIQAVKDLAGKDPIIVIHNGDLTQGNKYPSALVSDRIADQVIIGAENLRSWLSIRNVTALRVVAGTEAHNLGQGSTEILAARILGAGQPEGRVKVLHHGMMSVDGFKIDYAHHGPATGSRTWLKGNMVRFYLKDLMLREIMAGSTPPDLVLRAHRHDYVQERVHTGGFVSDIIVNPSYSMLGDHAEQVVQSPERVTLGCTVIEVVDGHLREIHDKEFMRTVDVRTKEDL
jgi:hypothetical protein